LSFQIDDDTIRETFKDCGEIVAIDWFQRDGQFRGSGTLEFESHEAAVKALALKDTEVMGRPMIVDLFHSDGPKDGRGARGGRARGERGGARGGRGEREPTPKPEGCDTVFLGNLSFQVTEEAVREIFEPCGPIHDIRWIERDGQFKGCAFVQFGDTNAPDKAVALAGTDILGRACKVDYAASKSRKSF